MGDVLNPQPPQWRNRVEEVPGDLVTDTARRLTGVLTDEAIPVVVQLAALRMVQKAVGYAVQRQHGAATMRQAFEQATAIAEQYTCGEDDTAE